MKLYSEERMKPIREQFEKKVLQKPNVLIKKMFGCPSYTVNDKLFAFLVTDGIVLTKLSEVDHDEALQVLGAEVFVHNQRVVKKWVRIPMIDLTTIQKVMPLVTKSYEHALREST